MKLAILMLLVLFVGMSLERTLITDHPAPRAYHHKKPNIKQFIMEEVQEENS